MRGEGLCGWIYVWAGEFVCAFYCFLLGLAAFFPLAPTTLRLYYYGEKDIGIYTESLTLFFLFFLKLVFLFKQVKFLYRVLRCGKKVAAAAMLASAAASWQCECVRCRSAGMLLLGAHSLFLLLLLLLLFSSSSSRRPFVSFSCALLL